MAKKKTKPEESDQNQLFPTTIGELDASDDAPPAEEETAAQATGTEGESDAAAEFTPEPDPTTELLRQQIEQNGRLIDKLSAPATQVPDLQEPPLGPQPNPIEDPEAFAAWTDRRFAKMERDHRADLEKRDEAAQHRTNEASQLEDMWHRIRKDEPELAKNEQAFVLAWKARGGSFNGEDPNAVRSAIVSQVREAFGTAAPAPRKKAPVNRTAGVAGGSAPPRVPAKEEDSGDTFVDLVDELETLQQHTAPPNAMPYYG